MVLPSAASSLRLCGGVLRRRILPKQAVACYQYSTQRAAIPLMGRRRSLTVLPSASISTMSINYWETGSSSLGVSSARRRQHPVRLLSTVAERVATGDGSKEIQRWSKQRLAETTQIEQLKPIVADIALRLSRQWDMLDVLHTVTLNLQQQEPSKKKTKETTTTSSNTGTTKKKVVAAYMTHDWWSVTQDDRRRLQISHALETLSKNVHSMKVLHQDTQKQCDLFHRNFPDVSSPLFQRQLGQAFKEIYARHALTIETMAEIVIDLRGIVDEKGSTMQQVNSIVTTFLKSRLLTQLLCDHIVDSCMNTHRKSHGAISVDVHVQELVQSAVTEARHLVEANFIAIAENEPSGDLLEQHVEEPPEPPQVVFVHNQSSSSDTEEIITATLVRPWLQYALVELLKNSLAATIERNRRDNDRSPFWPLYARIYETEQHVVVELLDQGGGLTTTDNNEDGGTNDTKKDWFEFANRRDKWDRMDDQQTYAMVSSPIRGLGVGLALSRMHLRLFGGDLILKDRPVGGVLDGGEELQRGATATLLLAKNFGTLETDIYE